MAGKSRKKTSGLHGPELRAFKHAVSKLKEKGLVKPSIDARKQRPTRYMRGKVKSLSGVLEGRLSPVLRSAKIAKEYRQAGFQVARNRVLLEPQLARKVRSSKQKIGEYMTVRNFAGGDGQTVIEQIILPVTVRNFDEFITSIRNGKLRELKRPQDVYAFQFYGNNSQATFRDLPSLLLYMENYRAMEDDEEGAWQHFTLFRVYPPGAWDTRGGPNQLAYNRRRRPKSNERRLSGKRVSRAHLSMDELREIERQQKRAQRDRESPDAKEKRLVKNRERMRKLRADRYAKGGGKKKNYPNRK